MNLDQQRAIVGKGFAGLTIYDALNTPEGKRPHYFYSGDELVMPRDHYHPDRGDTESLGQRERLKARLRELGIGYESGWNVEATFWALIWPRSCDTPTIETQSDLSEGAALLDACAKLAKEMIV